MAATAPPPKGPRRPRAGLLLGALLAVAWPIGTPAAGTGEENGQKTAPVELGPDQMRAAAMAALRDGTPQRAYVYSEALLRRDPNDRTALLIHSRAARDLGRFPRARTAARTAWTLSETDSQKYASSLVMAQALASGGQRTRAQWWLRRAVQYAPNEALTRKAVNDFRYVRARNRWNGRLNFSITPDSNINNGSSSDTTFLLGGLIEVPLTGAARALSGVEFALSADLRYRFYETETRAQDVTFQMDARHYELSASAKESAPGTEGNDFDFAIYSAGYAFRQINFDRRGEFRATADLGQTWYGGEEYTRFFRLGGAQSYRLGRGNKIDLRLAGEHQTGITTNDSDTLRADLSFTTHVLNGATFWTGATVASTRSPYRSAEFDEIGVRAQLTLAKPLAGATVQLGVGARNRSYDYSLHSMDGRQDDRVQADLTMIFRKVDYYGFNPTMQISASRTDSNIALYDSERIGINFGIRSAF